MSSRSDASRSILDDWDELLGGKGGIMAKGSPGIADDEGALEKWMRGQERKKPGQNSMSEHEEQCALMRMCSMHEKKYPELALMHAIPNGGARHAAVAAKLKAEGVRPGIPDLFLPAPRGKANGLYIEIKARGGRLSDAQVGMLSALERQGYACIVAFGWEAAWNELQAYLRSGTIELVSGTAVTEGEID